MSDPIKWDSKVVLAKREAVYGADPTPTGAANAIELKNVVFTPMAGSSETRDFERSYIGGQSEIPTGLHSKLAGEVELVGSGTAGTPPAWGPIFRALGMAEVIVPGTSVTYSPITGPMDSVANYFWVGNTRHVMVGSRGTGSIEINAQKIPMLKFTLSGGFAVPTEVAVPVTDYSAFKAAEVATTSNTPSFTINGVSMVLSQYTFDLGNDVKQRLMIGRENFLIADRAEVISAKVEATPLNILDPFTLANNPNARFPVNITHGTAAGYITTIAAPNCQMARLESYDNSDKILEWPLKMKPLPNSGTGNDQFTLTLT